MIFRLFFILLISQVSLAQANASNFGSADSEESFSLVLTLIDLGIISSNDDNLKLSNIFCASHSFSDNQMDDDNGWSKCQVYNKNTSTLVELNSIMAFYFVGSIDTFLKRVKAGQSPKEQALQSVVNNDSDKDSKLRIYSFQSIECENINHDDETATCSVKYDPSIVYDSASK